MRRCEDCKIILDDTVRYCPKCGKDVSANKHVSGTPSVQVGTLLTSANLHRIRQEWDAAIADATEAMRLDPANADIASLLGSIYEQRDMLDDAAIWYEIAVELNPNSTSDINKLNEVKSQAAAKRSNKKDPFLITQKRTKLLAFTMGGLCLLIVMLALFVSLARSRAHETRRSYDPTAAVSINPQQTQESPNTSAAPSGALNPVGTEGAAQDEPTPDLAGTVVDGKSSSLRTSGEARINSSLAASQRVLQTGAKVDDVIADPRQDSVIVTFSVQSTANVTKDSVIKAAYAVAASAFDSHRQVNIVTARCLITTGNRSATQIAFVGDIDRNTLEKTPQNSTGEQILAAFTNQWWNPQIN